MNQPMWTAVGVSVRNMQKRQREERELIEAANHAYRAEHPLPPSTETAEQIEARWAQQREQSELEGAIIGLFLLTCFLAAGFFVFIWPMLPF